MKKQIGTVFVDSGSVWVGDPCYVIGGDASHAVEDWNAYHKNLTDLGFWGNQDASIEPLGIGVGMHIQTYWGDGEYPVFAEMEDSGRIKSITIDLYGEDDENVL